MSSWRVSSVFVVNISNPNFFDYVLRDVEVESILCFCGKYFKSEFLWLCLETCRGWEYPLFFVVNISNLNLFDDVLRHVEVQSILCFCGKYLKSEFLWVCLKRCPCNILIDQRDESKLSMQARHATYWFINKMNRHFLFKPHM